MLEKEGKKIEKLIMNHDRCIVCVTEENKWIFLQGPSKSNNNNVTNKTIPKRRQGHQNQKLKTASQSSEKNIRYVLWLIILKDSIFRKGKNSRPLLLLSHGLGTNRCLHEGAKGKGWHKCHESMNMSLSSRERCSYFGGWMRGIFLCLCLKLLYKVSYVLCWIHASWGSVTFLKVNGYRPLHWTYCKLEADLHILEYIPSSIMHSSRIDKN